MKKVMNKVFIVCIALIMALLCSFTICAAENSAYILPDDVIIDENSSDIVSIPIYLSDNKGLMGFAITVNFNSDILKPVSVEKGQALGSGLFNDSIGYSEDGIVKVVWTGSENTYSDGLLFIIKFKVNSMDFCETKLIIDYVTDDTFNEKYEDVSLFCDSSTIMNRQGLLTGDVNCDGSIDVMDATQIQRYSAEQIELNLLQKELADINCDDDITIVDATELQRYISGMI